MYSRTEYRQYTKCIQGIDKILKVWYGSKSLTRGERATQASEPHHSMVW